MSRVVREVISSVFEGNNLMPAIWRRISSLLRSHPKGVVLLAYAPQSRDQQKIYHSCLRDLAAQVDLNGVRRDAVVWKRYTLASFYAGSREMEEFREEWQALGPLLLDDPDGDGSHLIVVRSTPFSIGLASAYLTYLHSLGDGYGVTWSPKSLGREANAANDAAAPRAEAA